MKEETEDAFCETDTGTTNNNAVIIIACSVSCDAWPRYVTEAGGCNVDSTSAAS
jgi:hypothetical protein